MRGFLFVLASLALTVQGSIIIYPEGASKVYDLTTGKDSSVILFACQVEGLPAKDAALKWYNKSNNEIVAKEGNIFVSLESGSLNLRIANPSKKDAGVYTCRGIIDGEEKEASKALKIWDGIKVLSDKEQYIVNGTDDKILCEIVSSDDFDEPLVSWFKVTLDESGKNSIWKPIVAGDKFRMFKPEKVAVNNPAYLEIRNVALSDQDTYLCNVNVPKLGKSHAHYINVIVTVPPTFTRGLSAQPLEPKENERLELSCEAEGIPSPRYNFTKYSDASRKNGEVVLENSTVGYYVIESVQRGDEGLYECVAMNQGGTENVSVEVNVRVPPSIEEAYNITEEEGRDIRLACVAIGDPAPELVWRKMYSPAYTSDPTQKIYVEEEQENQELDPVSRVFRRTLYLVIPSVEPMQSGQYQCEASSRVGMVQHTFHVNVTYKPTFGDKVQSHFYGWVDGNTNLTCMANGNPTPTIFWYKDDMEIKKDDIYDITAGETDVPNRVISYLIPRVDEFNQATVFGSYRCEARNDNGKNEVELTYHLAVEPDQPEATIVKEYPTAFQLELQRPMKEGGQPVTRFIVSYVQADDEFQDVQTVEVPIREDEDYTDTELTDLVPNTEYNINITAVNNVGHGLPVNLSATTADYSKPGKVEIISEREGEDSTSYTLRWTVPMTGGAEISNYQVEYAVVEKVNTTLDTWQATKVSPAAVTLNLDGEDTVHVKITKLTKNTYYQVKVKAVNRIGPSEVSTFVFKTNMGATSNRASSASVLRVGAAALTVVFMATTLTLF